MIFTKLVWLCQTLRQGLSQTKLLIYREILKVNEPYRNLICPSEASYQILGE